MENKGSVKWQEKKNLVLSKNDDKCYYCDRDITLEEMHIDHYIPKSKGGNDKYSNWVSSCPRCNLSKGSKLHKEFVQVIKSRISNLENELVYYKSIVNTWEKINNG